MVIALVMVAVPAFVFLVPIPAPALEPVNPNFLMRGGPIYGSIGAKYFGYGAVLQTPDGTWPFHWPGAYCIQYPDHGGYSFYCPP